MSIIHRLVSVRDDLYRLWYGSFSIKKFYPLPSTKYQDESRIVLRDDINKIMIYPSLTQVNSSWDNNLKLLRENILTSDPSGFISWPVIQNTMFHNCSLIELKSIKKNNLYRLNPDCIRETALGNPPPYKYHPSSSGNLIHHAYSIFQFISTFNIPLNSIRSIIEFGGGYGSMCRFMYQLGFEGTYDIFDIPEFVALQKYFLSTIKFYEPSKIKLSHKLSDMKNQLDPDLFIATWSLSESPLELRQKFLDRMGKAKYILIAYQKSFSGIDNQDYFKKLQLARPEYEWREWEIAHLPQNYYLMGRVK